jgi:hypothetical protein
LSAGVQFLWAAALNPGGCSASDALVLTVQP